MATIALVGAAHIHTPGFVKKLKDRPDVKVKLVWDHHADRAMVNADQLGAHVVKTEDDVWSDSDITAVVICSETNRHEPLVLAAALAGKHMFVEKPLGMAARDGYAMADAIEKSGVIFQTGYMLRSSAVHLYLREHVLAGTFGKITRIRGSNCHGGALGGWFDPKPDDPARDWRWMADPAVAGVGGFGDLGTHSLDLLIWLMGDVDAVTGTLDRGTARYGNCDETGEALLRFGSSVIGTLAAAWADVANPVSLLISGTEAHAAVISGQLYLHSSRLGSDGKQPWTDLPPGLPHPFDMFLDAITGRQDLPLVTPREAAYRSSVMEAIYQAAREQTWLRPR